MPTQTTSTQVLVVEDDAAIRTGVVDALTFHGYRVLEAATGDEGLEQAISSECDLILLDLVLPGQSGLSILEQVRRVRPTLAVIILTARGEENDRVRGLKLGADDYVVKPFNVGELLARIEAVLRRTPQRPTDLKKVDVPGGRADLESRVVQFEDGKRCELSQREADLLRYLALNAQRVVRREELLQCVWRLEPNGLSTRTIDMHISRLREKIRDDPAALIQTVRGAGYLFASSKSGDGSTGQETN